MIAASDGARLVGYARVGTEGQELALQLDALRNHGVANELIFTDKASGAKRDRPGLDACFRELRAGDILLVWRLDRLGRSVRHLVTLIDQLQDLGVGFRSVCDGAIDTTTPSSELIFHIFSSLAQFERRLIQERTKAGLAAARARGHTGGRPPLTPNDAKVALANKLFPDKSVDPDDICATLKISKTTLYRYVEIATGRVIRSRNHSRLRRHTGAAGPKTHTILRTLLGRQIAIRLGGIGPQAVRVGETPGKRRRKSNHFRNSHLAPFTGTFVDKCRVFNHLHMGIPGAAFAA